MADGSMGLDDRETKEVGNGAAPLSFFSLGVRNLIRQAFALFGLALIMISMPIAFVTPLLPIGLPIAIIGVILLGRNSIWGKRWMESVMARHPRVERFAPNWLMKAVFGREKSTYRDKD